MNENWQFAGLALLAYLAGSIPFGKIAGRFHGVDIQKKGSGNIGFANVRRVLGLKAGLAVLGGDLLKGFLPVLIAKHYLSPHQIMAVAGLTLAGHLFPVWLKFRGGKGVATCIGFSFAVSPAAGLVAAAIYVTGTAVLRKSAPASLGAVYSLPWLILIFSKTYFWFYVAVALIITWTHHSNIRQWREQGKWFR